MSQQNCCPVQDLQWTQRVVDNQYADIYFCASCGNVLQTEKYAVPTRFPYQGRCINCGGDQRESAEGLRCIECGKTALEDKDIHDRLANLHPSHKFLAAAQALSERGRHVLALKLSTAEIRWGQDPVNGMIVRIQTLEDLGENDRALDEAYEWADQEGSPKEVWGVIANLEAGVGNLKGATTALERGLNLHPEEWGWWMDYAEIMCHLDDRPGALRAGQKAIKSDDKEVIERAVIILAEVGERYYANGQYAEALGACSLANEHQEKFTILAWLRARIAATNQDLDYLVKWLEVTVALDPNHAEAEAMLEPYKKKSGGWFGGWS